MSFARQNYTEECEAGVNRQINMQLYASYAYLSLAYHFDRDDTALPGFHEFFKKLSDKEREHSEKLMRYQNIRGGRVLLQDVKKPEQDEWGSGLEAMMSALKLEKSLNQSLIDLYKIAGSKNDVHLAEFVADEYLKDTTESLKQMSDFVAQLNRAGPGLGEFMFDKETLQHLE